MTIENSALVQDVRAYLNAHTAQIARLQHAIKLKKYQLGGLFVTEFIILAASLCWTAVDPAVLDHLAFDPVKVGLALVISTMAILFTWASGKTKLASLWTVAIYGGMGLMWWIVAKEFIAGLGIVETVQAAFAIEDDRALLVVKIIVWILGVALFSIINFLYRRVLDEKNKLEDWDQKIVKPFQQIDRAATRSHELEFEIEEVNDFKQQYSEAASALLAHADEIAYAKYHHDLDHAVQAIENNAPSRHSGLREHQNHQQKIDVLKNLKQQVASSQKALLDQSGFDSSNSQTVH